MWTYEELPADPLEFFEAADARGWTDGLPVIPPTPDRVDAMLAGRPLSTSLGCIAPSNAELTHELLAVNAVMAGCSPPMFDALAATMSAILEPEFNLLAVQATTHPAGPIAIFNGAVRYELGLGTGSGCLGPGFRANATIGRAVRLVLRNVGNALPGSTDLATQGHAGKLFFVLGENEEESPWEPLAGEGGDPAHDSIVTVIAGEAPRNINDVTSGAEGLLGSIARNMAVPTINAWYYDGCVLVILCPEHAQALASSGLTRADVQGELYRRAQLTHDDFSPDIVAKYGGGLKLTAEGRIRIVAESGDILIVVAGGAGRHSSFVASFGNTRPVTRGFRQPARA